MDPNQQPVNTPQPVPATPPESPFATPAPTQVPPTSPYTATPPVDNPMQNPVQPTVQPAHPMFAHQPVETPSTVDPGKTLGIVSLVLGILALGLFALIVGIIAMKKSKSVGKKNGFALAGIILGIIEIIGGIIVGIFVVMALVAVASTCTELGSGTHVLTNGSAITCASQ